MGSSAVEDAAGGGAGAVLDLLETVLFFNVEADGSGYLNWLLAAHCVPRSPENVAIKLGVWPIIGMC
jgi:hypothetical protein